MAVCDYNDNYRCTSRLKNQEASNRVFGRLSTERLHWSNDPGIAGPNYLLEGRTQSEHGNGDPGGFIDFHRNSQGYKFFF